LVDRFFLVLEMKTTPPGGLRTSLLWFSTSQQNNGFSKPPELLLFVRISIVFSLAVIFGVVNLRAQRIIGITAGYC